MLLRAEGDGGICADDVCTDDVCTEDVCTEDMCTEDMCTEDMCTEDISSLVLQSAASADEPSLEFPSVPHFPSNSVQYCSYPLSQIRRLMDSIIKLFYNRMKQLVEKHFFRHMICLVFHF